MTCASSRCPAIVEGCAVALAEALQQTAPKVLVLDIETSPILTYSWSLFPDRISPDMVLEPSRVLCFAANWYPAKRVDVFCEWDEGGHAQMVKSAWRLLDEADICVGYNSDGFDIKHLNREFVLAGLGAPSPYQTIDLLKVIRQRFKFPSNRLGQIGQSLDIGAKLDTGGWPLWQAVLDGDEKARKKFARYNKQDVALTSTLLEMLANSGWIKGLPHAGLWSGDMAACYACGSTDLDLYGMAYTKTQRYLRLVCACGAFNKVLKNGETRPA
jgi:hypothetical protein